MTIQLVSQDRELYKLCREVLAEIPDPCVFSMVPPEDSGQNADLHIWDFHPNVPLPENASGSLLHHIFLVDRKDLVAFQRCTEVAEVNILLKPVTRATLATFLSSAVSRGASKSLRADRDEILQCLIQANLRLQEYDHDRTTFLARAVHDFRAPLTALSGYCGLLRGEQVGLLNENQKEVLRRMQNSANRLSRMASGMFELSVGRHVKRQPDLQPGDLRECLDQVLHEIEPFADEKSISISSELDASSDGLYFESGQIEQVMLNILDNACKFTPKAGTIEIRGYPFFWERRANRTSHFPADRRRRVVQDPNSYRIDIADSGTAIPAEHLYNIFEEYTSYSGGRDRSGGGLGLAICKMIITQHDGRIWARNRESGPIFSFVLPLHRSKPGLNGAASHLTDNGAFGGVIHADA